MACPTINCNMDIESRIESSIPRNIKFIITYCKVLTFICIRSYFLNITINTYFHIKSDLIFWSESQFQWKFNSGPSVPNPYLWSTTIVPPFKNLEKTKGTSVPLEYHYSTSILEVDPYMKTKKPHATFISFKSYLSHNYQNFYKMLVTRLSFSTTDCCGSVFSVLLHAPIPSDL